MTEAIIAATGLTRRYGGVTAVDNIDFAIEQGEVFGMLGPNGAGKTTTILMLLGLTDVTSGSVRVVGLDPTRDPLSVKRVVGYMPDMVGFYDHLTAWENLLYSGRLAGIAPDELDRRIDEALQWVRLDDVANRRSGAFSRGMRQRLGLAEVIMKRPRVAILDEPTNGLDPQAAREFLHLIRDLKADGITVLLSSHLLDRVQAVCDRVALFHRGRIALQGTVSDLAHQVLGGGYRLEMEAQGDDLERKIGALDGVKQVSARAPGQFLIEADRDVRPQVVDLVTRAGGNLLALALREPSLDEIYNRYFEEARHAA